jgi:hypothetical protein
MTCYIVDIEAVESRYTKQWKEYLPLQMRAAGLDVQVISGGEVPQATTPGAFLNFAGTNSYKSQQLLQIAEMFAAGTVKAGDYFLYTDAWNTSVIQLKYMSELLGIPVKIGGLHHAGSWDSQDFLGRLIGDAPWVRSAEHSMFSCYDHNFFATRFHVNIFAENLLGIESTSETDAAETLMEANSTVKIVGWPMEYLKDILAPYANTPKKQKIIFPHRLAPEKQVEIFRDLAKEMPEYEWFIAQEHNLTKHEYHTHLAESKIVFSANLQETLGISMFEGALVGAYPLVPDRLSYKEMWVLGNIYPSKWTENWESYEKHKSEMISLIRRMMGTNGYLEDTVQGKSAVAGRFFDGARLYQEIIATQHQ